MPDYPRIPYGWADFRAIRLEGRLYVDKTRFLRRLEEERYVFLIRPRRFGKSCWVSLLENYYDRNRAGEFDALFGGTDVGRRPTDDRHRYVVLRFDFSVFDDAPETLRERFETYCDTVLYYALERNGDLFPDAARRRILAPPAVDGKLNQLFAYAGEHGIPLYLLIDEYDNFANTILAHHGAASYRAFTHGGGFYRNFFATLKGGAGRGGGLERLFVTGVSPVTLDDVTSGFNIGSNVSLEPEFNEMMGFTEREVRRLVETYRDHGVFDQDVDAAMGVMEEWYSGYRFAKSAEDDIYHTVMVLHYLNESMPNRPVPDELIDLNVRIDYGKLRHFLLARGSPSRSPAEGSLLCSPAEGSLVVGRQLNGNFDVLRRVIGEETVETPLQSGFPLERLDQPENFLSLLHCFGLLSIRGVVGGVPRLAIPNQTVRRLLYGYLRDAYRDVEVFSVDLFTFDRLLRRMANEGAWEPVFAFLRDAVAAQTGIRDYIGGEKVIQGFLEVLSNVVDRRLT